MAKKDQAKKLKKAIKVVREHIKNKPPQELQQPKPVFRGVEVERDDIQLELDEMDQESRVHIMQEDLEYSVADRINVLCDQSIEKNNEDIRLDGKSICLECGSVIGVEDHIKGDDPKKYLMWVTPSLLENLYKQKRSVNHLLGE